LLLFQIDLNQRRASLLPPPITPLFQLATEGVKSKGKGKQSANTVSRKNSVTHNSRHLKAVAKVCSKIGRRDLEANALARYSKVHAALLNINKPVAAQASLRGKRGLGVAPGVFRVRLDISEKAKRIHKKHDAVSRTLYSLHSPSRNSLSSFHQH
jgi:hypothetical protein